MASVGDEHSRPPRLSDFGLTTADEEAIRRWYRFRLGSLAPLVVLIGIGGLIGIMVDTRIKAAGVGGLIGAMLWPWADEWIFPLFERLDRVSRGTRHIELLLIQRRPLALNKRNWICGARRRSGVR